MAKGPREQIKRRLDSSIDAVEKVLGYLVENGEMNREYHPEILEQYQIVFAYFEQGRDLLESLRNTY